jgi:hypothetical protein
MYFVCRPINLWQPKKAPNIEIHIVQTDPKLSNVSDVFKEENKTYINPFDAIEAAQILKKKTKVLTITITASNAIILKTKSYNKLLTWANKEYKNLRKCLSCSTIIGMTDMVCSQKCKDKQSNFREEETEFYLD